MFDSLWSHKLMHPKLQWTAFCQTSPPWPIHLGWSQMAWPSFTELDKAVVHDIILASFLWLCFQSVCPLMPSLRAYHLTWVSLTLDMGYLFTAAPAKRSHCSLPWMWGMSSGLPLLILDVGCLLSAAHSSCATQPLQAAPAPQPPLTAQPPCPLSHLPSYLGFSYHPLIIKRAKEFQKKHLLYWLCQSFWLCGSQ